MDITLNKRNFGADPEVFITTRAEKRNKYSLSTYQLSTLIPPVVVFENLKNKTPKLTSHGKKILFDRDNYRFIEDGAAAELNFKTVFTSSSEFHSVVNKAIAEFDNYLYGYGYSTIEDVVAKFDTEMGKDKDENWLDCIRFGCDPDEQPKIYDNFVAQCSIVDSSKHPYRYAGGHIHVQNMTDNPDIYVSQINTAPIIYDFLVGTTNVILKYSAVHQERERIKYFGFPGRCRIQNYGKGINGFEYRPPSNHWIFSETSTCSLFAFSDVAAHICEKEHANIVVERFIDIIPTLYKALVNFDKVVCKEIRLNVISFLVEANLIDILHLSNMAQASEIK